MAQGKVDILLGTQMIAKGLDFPNVTVVGVVDADTGLHLPDFRAAERTFQLVAQVAGRAGRGPKGGRVRSEEHTSELQSQSNLVCRLLLEKKKPLRNHASPHGLPLLNRERPQSVPLAACLLSNVAASSACPDRPAVASRHLEPHACHAQLA